ncbi:hypothetical protein [Nocardia colli]|uniref:hypothetical protein n=1 Tax=Nocardia colli TaxID=2545717 RepID=UPI00168D3F68|nr:hypothetical protein [Nocardia colli]
MSAPVDDFDLDVRISVATRTLDPIMSGRTSDADWCDESHCGTCGSACHITRDC